MKATLMKLAGAIGICLLGASCTTTYDARGRPVQSVTPEGAAMAAVAAGVLGYAIGNDNDRHRHRGRHYYARSHCAPRHYGYGGYGYSRYDRCY